MQAYYNVVTPDDIGAKGRVLINGHQLSLVDDVSFIPNSGHAASPLKESAMCQQETLPQQAARGVTDCRRPCHQLRQRYSGQFYRALVFAA
jgi:hypothetical protein